MYVQRGLECSDLNRNHHKFIPEHAGFVNVPHLVPTGFSFAPFWHVDSMCAFYPPAFYCSEWKSALCTERHTLIHLSLFTYVQATIDYQAKSLMALAPSKKPDPVSSCPYIKNSQSLFMCHSAFIRMDQGLTEFRYDVPVLLLSLFYPWSSWVAESPLILIGQWS